MREFTTIGMRTILIGDAQRLEIHIKAPRSIVAIVMLIITAGSLAFCTVGGVISLWSLLSGHSPIPILLHILWQCGWLVGELAMIYLFLWPLCGQEIITITRKKFVLKRDVLGWGKTESFGSAELENLRASTVQEPFSLTTNNFDNGLIPLSGGTIVADVLGKPYRFGIRLDEAEALAIIEAMRPYL